MVDDVFPHKNPVFDWLADDFLAQETHTAIWLAPFINLVRLHYCPMLLGSNFSSKNGPDYQYLSHFNSDHHFSQVPCYQFALFFNFAPGSVPPRAAGSCARPGSSKSPIFIYFFYQNFPTSLKNPLPRFSFRIFQPFPIILFKLTVHLHTHPHFFANW